MAYFEIQPMPIYIHSQAMACKQGWLKYESGLSNELYLQNEKKLCSDKGTYGIVVCIPSRSKSVRHLIQENVYSSLLFMTLNTILVELCS